MSTEALNQNEVGSSTSQEADLPLFDQEGVAETAMQHGSEHDSGAQGSNQDSGGTNQQDNQGEDGAVAGQRQRAEKSEISKEVLANAKAAVKMFESLSSHSEIDDQIRGEIEQLMSAQKKAMERKLSNEPCPEGEDFDSISKRLRRANNKLDSHIEKKHGLNSNTVEGITKAIASLEKMLAKVKEIEEEVG